MFDWSHFPLGAEVFTPSSIKWLVRIKGALLKPKIVQVSLLFLLITLLNEAFAVIEKTVSKSVKNRSFTTAHPNGV